MSTDRYGGPRDSAAEAWDRRDNPTPDPERTGDEWPDVLTNRKEDGTRIYLFVGKSVAGTVSAEESDLIDLEEWR